MSTHEQQNEASLLPFSNQVEVEADTIWEKATCVVEHLIIAALLECCSVRQYRQLQSESLLDDLKSTCAKDLLAFARKDPSSQSDIEVLARTSTSYAAVLHYRVANWVYRNLQLSEYAMLEALISQRGKLLSGAEIHFKCSIGERFVLDHGYGSVIGETAVLGDDCYILAGVTLGSRQIANNTPGPRHPHLGNRIQVGMNAKLLGHIFIKDDAFIGTGCVVTRDVPASHKITLKQAQIITFIE